MRKDQSKILIVDDEPDILEFLCYNLEQEGYTVKKASNGTEAIKLAQKYEPDLVVLDIMMPKMDGVEVCRQLRQKSKHDDMLIAFLTARGEDYTQIAALDQGGDDFIRKPIKPGVFKSRIKALLRRKKKKGKHHEHIREIKDIIINTEEYKVTKKGKAIELARKEFELFYLLSSKPGKVFRREEILAKVWGVEVIVGSRTIDVHIRKLREKFGNKLIKTIKGVGYKIDF